MINWNEFDRGVFLVNCQAIVYDPETRLILLGRRENDPYLKQLTWSFPGGRPGYEEDLEHYVKKEVKKKTNLDVEVEKIVFAKTYPEKREFLSIYYLVKVVGGTEKAMEKFKEIKWVKPTEIKDYFAMSTSLHPKLFEYLKTLEQVKQ